MYSTSYKITVYMPNAPIQTYFSDNVLIYDDGTVSFADNNDTTKRYITHISNTFIEKTTEVVQ